VMRLHEEMRKIVGEADIQSRIRTIGLIPVEPMPIEAIQRYIVAEEAKWGGIVRKLGLGGSQ
jgi:hypothetical protein